MLKNIQKKQNILICVGSVNSTFLDSVREYTDRFGEPFRVLVLLNKNTKKTESEKRCDFVYRVDFNNQHKIATALLPHQDELLAVAMTAGEANVPLLAKVIPHVPYLRTPSTESLAWASDKYEMRKRLFLYDPVHTPKFSRVKNTTSKEINRIIEKVGFPMVVKPANLSASSFVTVNYHQQELEKNIKTIFRGIKKAYKTAGRLEEPKVIVEEYMDGLMYSVDSYVNGKGEVTHCPLVRVKTGKDIGHDDFYNYIRITPTALKQETIKKAESVAETAIHALGLRYTTTHTELMRVDDDWKIIEIGARRGGFRDLMYQLSCDINHALNDVLVRIPKKTIIPKKCKGFSAVIQKFGDKEGYILEMKGAKKIEELSSFHKITWVKKVGDKALFAKNGGKSIFNLFLYNSDRAALLADIRRVEQLVEIKIGKKKPIKPGTISVSKKTAKK